MSQPIVSEGGTQPLASSTLSDLEPVPPRWVESLFAGRTAVPRSGRARRGEKRGRSAPARNGDRGRDGTVRRPSARSRGGRVSAPRIGPRRHDHAGRSASGISFPMWDGRWRPDSIATWSSMPGGTTGSRRRCHRVPFQHAFATASAVGVNGIDLVIHCLAAASPPEPVENPRQRSPWLYSDRYGPLPPCFSRASIAPVAGRKQLLIGGTASIVGEDSRHLLDTGGQLDETFRNLASVVMTARRSEEPVGTGARAADRCPGVRDRGGGRRAGAR